MPSTAAISDLASSIGLPDLSGVSSIPDLLSELGSNAEGILGGTMNSVIDTSSSAFNSLCSADFASAFGGQMTSVYDINAVLKELCGSLGNMQSIGSGLSGFGF